MPSSSTRHRVALVLALLGLAMNGVILWVERQLATDVGYSSFCNLGGVVNCDVVLSSRYGKFLDLPVSLWAAAAFTVGAIAALPGAFAGATGGLPDLVLLGLASAGLGFGAVLAGVMALVLHRACLLCLTVDVVVVAWFVTVIPLIRNFEVSPRAGWSRRRAMANLTAAGALVAALAGGTLAAVRTPATATSVDEVVAHDPEFARHYRALPVVPIASVLRPDAPARGRSDASITIVEFSDFQCPACAQAFKDLHELQRDHPEVRLVFRNFPLDAACNDALPRTIHPDACNAAAAGICAARQNRFWEYHDLLFEHQRMLDRDSLFRYAREVGLDIATFRTCLDDPATRAVVAEDARAGIAAGVESTPTLFVNGRRINGALEHPYYDYALVLEGERGGSSPGRP